MFHNVWPQLKEVNAKRRTALTPAGGAAGTEAASPRPQPSPQTVPAAIEDVTDDDDDTIKKMVAGSGSKKRKGSPAAAASAGAAISTGSPAKCRNNALALAAPGSAAAAATPGTPAAGGAPGVLLLHQFLRSASDGRPGLSDEPHCGGASGVAAATRV